MKDFKNKSRASRKLRRPKTKEEGVGVFVFYMEKAKYFKLCSYLIKWKLLRYAQIRKTIRPGTAEMVEDKKCTQTCNILWGKLHNDPINFL